MEQEIQTVKLYMIASRWLAFGSGMAAISSIFLLIQWIGFAIVVDTFMLFCIIMGVFYSIKAGRWYRFLMNEKKLVEPLDKFNCL